MRIAAAGRLGFKIFEMARDAQKSSRPLEPIAAAAALTVLIGLCVGLFGGARAQDAQPNIMMILDSSRSMWGQIDGINKVVSARSVIGAAVKKFEKRAKFGLIAYGHRQSAGCRDIEVLLPLGAHRADSIAKIVSTIRPKGSTPIAASLTEAAKAAASPEQKVSIILIADGLDNCQGDPCAVASQLKKQSKDLTIHAIAFDHKQKAALESLACIAENTGGIFASATTESEFLTALDKAVDLTLNPALPAPAVAATTRPDAASPQPAVAPREFVALPDVPQAEPAAPSDDQEPAQALQPSASTPEEKPRVAANRAAPVPVNLTALLTEAGPEIKRGLVWRIFESTPAPDGRYLLINTFREAKPTTELRPGQYLINAAYGLSHITKKITVAGGQSVTARLVLNAGGLRLSAAHANGQPLATNAVRYDIFADEADQFGDRQKVIGDAKPGLIIRLNAGAYHIVSVYGDANAVVRADVTVEPGKLTEATVNHTAARVTFKLVLQPGGEALANTHWNILTQDGDVVKESVGALPTHVLAAGRYTVLARFKDKNYTRDFTIASGDIKQIEVVIR